MHCVLGGRRVFNRLELTDSPSKFKRDVEMLAAEPYLQKAQFRCLYNKPVDYEIMKIHVLHLGLWLASLVSPSLCNPIKDALAAHCGTACRRGPPSATFFRSLKGSGFHRSLQLTATFHRLGRETKGQRAVCEVAFIQPLPAVLYANIYELDNAAHLGQGPKSQLFGKIDVESIEQHSEPTVLVIYANTTPSLDSPHCRHCSKASVAFPLHARYPLPRELDEPPRSWIDWLKCPKVDVVLPPPAILTRCDRSKAWRSAKMPKSSVQEESLVIWELPAGNMAHTRIVAVVTSLIIMVAGASVAHAVVDIGGLSRSKKASGGYRNVTGKRRGSKRRIKTRKTKDE